MATEPKLETSRPATAPVESAPTSASLARPSMGCWARLSAWLALIGSALCSAALYVLLLQNVPFLAPAEQSYAGELFPAAESLLRGSLLELRELELGRTLFAALHTAGSARYLALLLVLFGLYGLALWIVAGRRSTGLTAIAMTAGALFLGLQAFSPALLSSDIYSYIIYGRIFLSGGSPYTEVPASYPDDPYLSLVYWKLEPSFYGPLWTLLSAGLAWLGGEQVGVTVLLFRLVAIGAALLTGGLIWAILARAAPDRAAQGVVFFLWNPLVVLESGLSAHNDVVMAALLVLAVWLYLRCWRSAGLVALALAALVKFVTVPLLPLYVLLVLRRLGGWRRRARFLALGLIGASLATWGVLSQARVGPEVLAVGALGSSVDRYQNNVHTLLFQRLQLELGLEREWAGVPLQFKPWWVMTYANTDLWLDEQTVRRLPQWTTALVLAPQTGGWLRVYVPREGAYGVLLGSDAGPVLAPEGLIDPEVTRLELGPAASPAVVQANALIRLVGLSGFGLVWLLAAWRASSLRTFLSWSVALLLVFYWLSSTWIWPWYVIWVLAPAALVPSGRLAGLAAVLSAGVLSLYVAHGYQNAGSEWIFEYRSLAAFAFPLALFLISLVIWRGGCALLAAIRLVGALLRGRLSVGAA